MINPAIETKARVRRTKVKSPEFHELQRLKNLSARIQKKYDRGGYEGNLAALEAAIISLDTMKKRIQKLEAINDKHKFCKE